MAGKRQGSRSTFFICSTASDHEADIVRKTVNYVQLFDHTFAQKPVVAKALDNRLWKLFEFRQSCAMMEPLKGTAIYTGDLLNACLVFSELPLHIATGSCRAPCYNSHVFAVKALIDLCPVAGGIDPLEFRLQRLKNWPRPGEKKLVLPVP